MKYTEFNLTEVGKMRHADYISAMPFPHICLDNVFTQYALNQVLSEWHNLTNRYHDRDQKKHASSLENDFGLITMQLMHEFNSLPFLQFLCELTGIKNLIPDPEFLGGGLHEIKRGGLLGMHVDFNIHPRTKLNRRINVLIYLNKDWKAEYGGDFYISDGSKKNQYGASYSPIYNRMVIFSTTETSWHGHPYPLTCPWDMSRKSIALYYYTHGRDDGHDANEHSTIFTKKPPIKRVLRQKVRETVKIWYPKFLKGE